MDERFAPVLAEMRRQVEAGIRPSIQIAVDWRGEIVFDQAYGDAANDRSCYLMFSSTKPIVAVALLQLIEAGRASLDDRVEQYIPEFGKHGKAKCTIAHLLTHRGGFPDTSREHQRGLRDALHSWDDLVAYVCDMQAAWEPGLERGYHPGSGWIIVGELIQRLSDQALPEYLRERVLTPAGIVDDAFSLGEPDRLREPAMKVQTSSEKGAPGQREADYWNQIAASHVPFPSAGGISCAREVIKFYRALLNQGEGPGGRLLSAEMVRRATFPWAVGTVDRTFQRDIPWGLGFHLKHARPSLDDCGVTATPGTFGHGGHFLVNTAWGDPGKDLAVCILANGLFVARPGIKAVAALSQTVHDVVDRAA